jgi:hypothetical protein
VRGNTDFCFAAVTLNISVCWDVMLCSLVGYNQCLFLNVPRSIECNCAQCAPLSTLLALGLVYWASPQFYTNALKRVISVYVLHVSGTVKLRFCYPRFYVVLHLCERLGKLKKFSDLFRFQTRNLPACSIVHQPTM